MCARAVQGAVQGAVSGCHADCGSKSGKGAVQSAVQGALQGAVQGVQGALQGVIQTAVRCLAKVLCRVLCRDLLVFSEPENLQPQIVFRIRQFSIYGGKCHTCDGICTLSPLNAALLQKTRNTTRLKCCACHEK